MKPNTFKHIDDISKFFKTDTKNKIMTFIGDTLDIFVLKRFENQDLISISDKVNCVGIMDMVINNEYNAQLHLLSIIQMSVTETSTITIEGKEYYKFSLTHGDIFMHNTQLVKNQSVIYAVYVEFLTRGNLPYHLSYDKLATVFDSAKEVCDVNLPVNHAIFEMMYSHLSRSKENKFQQYRYTDMKDDFDFIGLNNVAYAPDSTSARMLGSYFSDGTLASLLHKNEKPAIFEDLLRGKPIGQ